MTTIADNLQAVRQRLAGACADVGRDVDSVTLLAVSKTFGPDAVAQAVGAGQRAFGENYIQEGVEKVLALQASHPGRGLVWHCIGPVQSNKTRLVATHFDWVHSVDRFKIAQRLSEQRPPGCPSLQICLQVNVDQGANKAGVEPGELPALAAEVKTLSGVALRGLMCIPEPSADPLVQRRAFRRLRELFDQLNVAGCALDTLSMGMSDDLEAAVAEGSTLVRVGRAIFGDRPRRSAPFTSSAAPGSA